MADRPEWVRDRTSSLGPRHRLTWHFADVYDFYLKRWRSVLRRMRSSPRLLSHRCSVMREKFGSANVSKTALRFVRHRLGGAGRKAQDGRDDITDARVRSLIGRLVAGWWQGMRIHLLGRRVAVFDALVDPLHHVGKERIG